MQLTLTTWSFWRWVLLLVSAAAMALFVWLVGPRISFDGAAPFTAVTPRVLTTVVILLIAGMVALYWLMSGHAPPSEEKERQKNQQKKSLVASLEAPPTSRAQKEAMERGFQLALGVLRRIRTPGFLNRRYKYELPWYAVIGAEQSGKSALIRASGLRFPLNETRNGQINGGTISLSFTDQAVLIETRGPMVPASEENTWSLFGTLLKRYRSRQPINGIILVLSLSDLMKATDAERFSLHADLRDQLERFQTTVKARVPIYVVFSKTDIIPGFDEFCADLTPTERQAVFGVTLPLYDERGITTRGKPLPATFSAEFDNFLRWQMPRMVSQVSQGFGVGARFDCFMMLPHLATVKPLIADLVEDVFKPTTYDRPLLLRGFYFTSTQAGSPRDANALPPAGGAEAGAGRKAGLFIHDLFDKVILNEAGLVAHDPTVRRNENVLRWGIATAGITASLILLSWWTISFVANRYLIRDLEVASDKSRAAISALDANPVVQTSEATDFASVLPVLNSLASLPTGWDSKHQPRPWTLEGGLSQTRYLAEATRQEYVEGLDALLMPRIIIAVQREIAANMNNPDALYQALKVYLMLGHAGPIDKPAIAAWVRNMLSDLYPGPTQAPLRNSLMDHVQNALDSGIPPIELEQDLVNQARNVLNAYPAANQGMSILQNRSDIRALPAWRVTDVAGPLAPYSLTRRSGRPLNEAIDGMYTSAAFFTTVIPAISEVATAIISDDWVRFPVTPSTSESARIAQLTRDITDLYVNDYISTWQNLVSDVTLAGFDNLQAELAVLQATLGPPSPLSSYLQAVTKETTVTPPDPSSVGKAVGAVAGAAAGAAVTQAAGTVSAALQPANTRLKALAQSVTARFSDLHTFVNGSPSPVDEVLRSMSQLRALLGPAASMGAADPSQITELTSGPQFAQILSQLKLNTLTAPPALAESIVALVRQTSTIANAGVKADLDSAWKTQVLPFCQAAINGKFPFASSPNDATLADFARMFAPDGLMDQFFNKQLKPFVDTLSTPWRPLTNVATRPDISPAGLALFEQAAKIRAAFFPNGGTTPEVGFTITPTDLDPGAMRVKLEIDGQSLTYQYGPNLPTTMKWPGNVGSVRVEFGVGGDSGPAAVSFTGPFALYRFLAARGVNRISPTRINFSVNLGPRSASFALDAASVNNPFQRPPYQGFRCPTSLVQ